MASLYLIVGVLAVSVVVGVALLILGLTQPAMPRPVQRPTDIARSQLRWVRAGVISWLIVLGLLALAYFRLKSMTL